MDAAGNVKNIIKNILFIFQIPVGQNRTESQDWYKETMQGLKNFWRFSKEENFQNQFWGQMHELVILDDKDEVIRPAILWFIMNEQQKNVII